MRVLYHGSISAIVHPNVKIGRAGLDFGLGFYTTDIEDQALQWAGRIARRELTSPIVSVYNFDEDAAQSYRKLTFSLYDVDWLSFIVKCRGGFDPSTIYDYVEGGVANDRVIDTVEGFINGTIDESNALRELSKHQPNNQICFLNQRLVDECLVFKGTK